MKNRKFLVDMYARTDKRRIFQIMDMYLTEEITTSSFCDEFHCSYNVELNHDSLEKKEHEVLCQLGEVSGRCTEFEEDHKNYPGVYYTERELKEKVAEAKEKLKKMNNEFEIVIASLPDKENLVAEIFYQNICWVEISKETEEIIIQFHPHPRHKYWEFPLEDALTVLEKAKKRFLEMQVPRD